MRKKLQLTFLVNAFLSLKAVCGFSLKSHKSTQSKFKISALCMTALFFLLTTKGFSQLANETFESGIPATWTLFENGAGTSTTWLPTADGYLGSNAVSINPSLDNIGDQNTAQYFLVTPQFPVPENGEIHFYTKQGSEVDHGTQYQIRLSTAAQPDINGFNVILQSYTESNLNIGSQTTYEEKVVEIPSSIPAGLNIYIAFVATNTQNGATPTGDEWFVDNVSSLTGCIEVADTDFNIDNITVEGAELTWSHPEATNFELQVLPEGGTPAGSGIPVSGTSYTLSNLDEDTSYDIYIRSICSNNTISEYSGPFNFKTLKYGLSCDSPIVLTDITTAPYVLIDNLANWANPDVVYSTQGSNCISGTSTANYLNGNKIFLSYTPTQDGLISLTQTTSVVGGGGGNNCYNALSSLFVYEGCNNVGVNCFAGALTTTSNVPGTISNLLVQANQTYIIVVSSQLPADAGICFQLEISSPTCAAPSNISYNDLTQNSVSFSWDNIGGFSDSWEYAVVPVGAGEPTGSGTSTNTNVANLINTGLAPGTTYDLYVRSVCSGTPGNWSDPYTFTTQCTIFNTPYSTDFSTATNTNPEPCWTTIDANGDGNTWAFIGGYATVRTDISRYENNDLYISPQINFDGTQKRLRYKYRSTQGTSTYTVKLSTTGVGVDNFTTVILPETQVNNTGFQEITIDIPQNITGNVNIAWIVEPNTTENALRFSIDDVVIEDKPSCPNPTAPFFLNVTQTSAWLFWNPGESETQWQVAIQDLDSGIPTGDGLLVTSNFPYVATDLTIGHQYEFYVRAYCAADDQSEWVGPVAFTTLCGSYDTPFYESFNDDDTNTQKFCWNTNNGGWTISETQAEISGGTNSYLISPAINIDGVKELKYKYRAEIQFIFGNLIPPRYGMEVRMSTTTNNPASFNTVVVPFETFTNSGFIEKSVIIEGSGTIYLAFRVPPEFTGPSSQLDIDDVSITDAPPCPIPSNLVVNTVTSTGADVSWSAGYQETAWNIVVQPAGTGIPTGSGVAVTTSNYVAPDLTPDTEYECYVQSNCGSDTSEWFGPVTFRTLCSPFTTPFTETFNSDSMSESCWKVIDNNADLDTWELNSGVFAYEGDQAAAMFTGHNGQNEDWLISPTITISENQRLRYYYRVNDSFFTEDLEVLLSTNGTGLDQFTTVLYDSDDDPVLINNEEYKVKIINFPTGITGNVNIAFHVPYFASTGPYRGQTLVIDNVNVEDIPACPEIINVETNNLTDTQVQVSWDANGTVSPWEISVQPSGTPAPVGDTDPNYLYNASTNPFTVTGLTASTMYDIYVRSACDSGEGEWTGPIQITTLCSFDNLCSYTLYLTSDSDVSAELVLSQNNQITQSFPFEGQDAQEFPVLLCSGVQFSLYFDTIGTNATQYANYTFEIRDADGMLVYSSPNGLIPRTTVYTGYSTCGNITCPAPTDLTVSETSVFSWTPGGSESQWEVAIQPLGNGTIPQSGTIVSTNSYTPTASDFVDPYAATYEYFVRAICGTDDESYWTGPYVFVRNDDVSNAVTLPINSDESCNVSSNDVSFIHATASSETMSCDGLNAGDVWFNFTAESLIHIFEINNFTGDFRGANNGQPPYPDIIMTLYKDNGAGGLEELSCTYDKLLVAMYSSELVIGDNYKLRLTLNGTETNEYTFSLCVTTPENLCDFNVAVNGGFEVPVLGGLSGVNTIISMKTVPGWRLNLETNNTVFIWESLNAPGFTPYEGGQVAQLRTDQGVPIDPNDPNIKGYYRDFDTSEITLYNYSFAHNSRFNGNNIQLYAGAPGGPYTLVTEHLGDQQWRIISGGYVVPDGQDVTRFIFRANGSDNIGNLLDDVRFVANNEIITQPLLVDCNTPIATVEANGTGTWIADANNPGVVTITNPNSNTTTITDFLQPGVYTFTWKTRYCENTIAITYDGIADIPTVETPVEYCLNATAQPLTATPTGGYTLMWYTQATGGTGTTTAPTPDTSTAGSTSYYVANVDTNGCEGPRAEINVIINALATPELTFSYPTTCEIATENPVPTFSTGFAEGGVFSSTTLTVDATTGEIDMASATVGQHQVAYTYAGDATTCTASGTYIATIQFTQAANPITTFDYGTDAICVLSTTNLTPNLATGFNTGGVFSSTTLTVDAATGEIDMASATAGNHDILYTYAGDATTCTAAGTSTATISFTDAVAPVTMFSYVQTDYCLVDASNIMPELATGFTQGGQFSSTTLTVNPTTGEIDITSATEGAHQVVYTYNADETTCTNAGTYTATINFVAGDAAVTDFSYENDIYCSENGSVLPILATGFTQGGQFSSSAGLVINATTGEIDVNASTSGDYTITYTVSNDATNCVLAGQGSTSISILSSIAVSIEEDCVDGESTLTASPLNNSFDASNATYTWFDANNNEVGSEATLNLTDYANANPNAVTPATFKVEVVLGGCSTMTTIVVNRLSCGAIPRGISPNGDGKNDALDLTGYGVVTIEIFNRYGTKVFAYKGNYTNQWHGQSKNGEDLPSATYFYTLQKQDGSSATGWIYINREY